MKQLLLVVLLLVPLTALAAQEVPSIEDGTQVRVKTASSFWVGFAFIGPLVSLNADTLVMRLRFSGPMAIPLATVTKLEIKKPSIGHWRKVQLPLTKITIASIMGIMAPPTESILLPPQETTSIEPGTRIRLNGGGSNQIIGTFISLEADSDLPKLFLERKDKKGLQWSAKTKRVCSGPSPSLP